MFQLRHFEFMRASRSVMIIGLILLIVLGIVGSWASATALATILAFAAMAWTAIESYTLRHETFRPVVDFYAMRTGDDIFIILGNSGSRTAYDVQVTLNDALPWYIPDRRDSSKNDPKNFADLRDIIGFLSNPTPVLSPNTNITCRISSRREDDAALKRATVETLIGETACPIEGKITYRDSNSRKFTNRTSLDFRVFRMLNLERVERTHSFSADFSSPEAFEASMKAAGLEVTTSFGPIK